MSFSFTGVPDVYAVISGMLSPQPRIQHPEWMEPEAAVGSYRSVDELSHKPFIAAKLIIFRGSADLAKKRSVPLDWGLQLANVAQE